MKSPKPLPTVLLVEDNRVQYASLRDFFLREGYAVVAASPGAEVGSYEEAVTALEVFGDPDLAVLDVHLKTARDGFAVGNYLRKKYPCLPIVFLTSEPSRADSVRSSGLASNGYLPKSVMDADYTNLLLHIDSLTHQIELQQKRKVEETMLNVREARIEMHTRDARWRVPENARASVREYPPEKRRVVWADILLLQSGTAFSYPSPNEVLLLKDGAGTGFVCRASLSEMERLVPAHFVRANASVLVNAAKFPDLHADNLHCEVAGRPIEFTKKFRADAQARLRLLRAGMLGDIG